MVLSIKRAIDQEHTRVGDLNARRAPLAVGARTRVCLNGRCNALAAKHTRSCV